MSPTARRMQMAASGGALCTDGTFDTDILPDGAYVPTTLDTGQPWAWTSVTTFAINHDTGPGVLRLDQAGLLGSPFCAGCAPAGNGLRLSLQAACDTAGLWGIGSAAPALLGPPGQPGFLLNLPCGAPDSDLSAFSWDAGTLFGTLPAVVSDADFHEYDVRWVGTNLDVYVDTVFAGTIPIGSSPSAGLWGWCGGLAPEAFGDFLFGCAP